jgi:hypothetical protein
MSREQNAGQNHNIKTDNNAFESVEQLQYLETTVTNQNSIQEETKSRLKSWNSCYHSVQNLLSSSLLSRNIKIETKRTTILSVRRLRVFDIRVLRRIFGPKRDE